MKKLILVFMLLGIAAQADQLLPTGPEQAVIDIQQIMTMMKNTQVNGANQIMRKIWNNHSAAPCDIWTQLGTKAVGLLTASVQLQAFVNGVAPGSLTIVQPAGYTLTPNSDGASVTCVAPAPSPSPSMSP